MEPDRCAAFFLAEHDRGLYKMAALRQLRDLSFAAAGSSAGAAGERVVAAGPQRRRELPLFKEAKVLVGDLLYAATKKLSATEGCEQLRMLESRIKRHEDDI